jgi:Leucine Rich repeat
MTLHQPNALKRLARSLLFFTIISFAQAQAPALSGAPQEPAITPKTITNHTDLASPQSWTATTAQLLSLTPTGESTGAESVPAKTVDYQPRSGQPILLSLISDPRTKSSYIVRGEKPFYLTDPSDMLAGMLGSSELILTRSFFKVSTPPDGDAGVIRRFAAEIDDQKLQRENAPSRDIRIGLAQNVPFQFWTADSGPSSQPGLPTITAVNTNSGLLRLDLLSPLGKYKGTFWIDIPAAKVVRTVIDGKEVMNQSPNSAVQKTTGICMWNDAVCQRGDWLSIGMVATDADMSKLDHLQGAKNIGFIIGPDATGGPQLTDAGFMHIQNLHELEVLDAIDLPLLTDDSLVALSNLSHLREARFEGNRNFTDAGLAHLAPLIGLRTLTFHEAPITDHGIQYLRASTDLEILTLGRSRITDTGAHQIAQFRKLKTLDLQGTQITDKGMADIATLPNLQWLCIKQTSITDQGVLALRSVGTLRDLYISPAVVKDATITTLQQSLPELKIHFQ